MSSDRDDREPTVLVTDALGHDLPGSSAEVSRQMLEWLELEDVAGEISPGLSDLRDLLREEAM